MKLKKLLALTLSMAMIFTSFTVPALADEIVESVETVEEVATEEVVIEEVTEAATEVEETTEVTEAEEVVTEEEVEAAKAEDTEGSTYTVATGKDLIRFLTTKDKYALSKDNKDKMVTFVLSNDIEVSANKIAIPADRYITIDLNGYDLKKSVVDSDKPIVLGNDGDKYAMLVIESSVEAYDVNPDPDNEYWDYPEIDLDFDVAGGEKDKALLEIGRNVNYYGKATAKNGIIKVDDGAVVFGQVLSTTDKDDVNIQGTVRGLVSGNSITLANAYIMDGEVCSTGNLLIRGNTENNGDIVVASGKATIAADNKKSEVGIITIKAADVVMESGRATQIELDDPKATFTMNGGRVDCSGDVGCYAIQEGRNGEGALKNVKLIGGVVAGYEHAMVDKKKYIINGVESDTEDIATVGEIADFSDLKKAVNNGGNYVLVDEVYADDFDADIEINKNLTITGTPNYGIYNVDQNIIVASNVTFTTNVNIYGSVDELIDVSAENAKLVMLGGTIATDGGNAIKDGADFTKDKALKNVEIYGGTICGAGGYGDLVYDTNETNCAIVDKNYEPYKDAAARLVGGVPYVNGEVKINKDANDIAMDYILMMGDANHNTVNLDEIFEPLAYGVSEASVSYNCVFADGSKKFAGMEITGSFAEDNGKITYDGKGNGATKLICNVSYGEKVLASTYVVIESSSEKNLDALAEKYNATLVKTVDTMNAYEKAHRVYFDFHLDSSEAGLLGASEYELFKPKYASIDAPKGSRFSYYFEQNLVNGLYDVKYDTDKGMYYVELKNQTTSGIPTSTKVAEDRISSFSGLNIRLQFFEAGSREPLFTVPMTKYAYQRAIPESAKGENKEQALTLNIDQKAPSLTLKEGAMLTINAAFDGMNGAYDLEYPELEDANSNITTVTPGYITASQIYNVTNKDVDLQSNYSIWMNQRTGSFKYDSGRFFYVGSADEAGKDDKLTVRVAYKDYVGDYALSIPVKVVKTYPQPTLKKSSFSVVKGSAIANIPLTFTSSDPDSVGGISRVEVVSGRKVFTVTQSYEPVKSVNNKSFTRDGFMLNIAGIADKSAAAKIKVYFDYCKPNAGRIYSKTYDIKVKTVDESKMKVKAKSKDVLNLVATGTSSAEYTVTTNPEYYASADISVSVNAYAKGSKSPVAAPWLSVSKLVDGKVTVKADNPAANASSIKNIKLEFKVGAAAKPTYVKVKTNAKAASINKPNISVTMKLGAEDIKEYNNGELKVDNTALKMAKTVNYKANNLTFASVSGNDANLFRVKDVVVGKSVKVIPRLDALKAGLIEAGKEYKFDLDLKELGTGKLTDKKINVTVKVAAIKENKVKAAVDTKDVSLSTAAANGSAKFVIKTIQPYYGMKISEITIDSKTKNADKYVIEAVNAGSGFTAYGTEDGKTNSEFRIAFKDGKAPVVKNKLLKGAQKLTLIVKYENGLTAKVPLLVNIDVEPKAVAEEETAKAKKK